MAADRPGATADSDLHRSLAYEVLTWPWFPAALALAALVAWLAWAADWMEVMIWAAT